MNPFQPSVACYIETNYLICFTNQVTGFYLECNIGLRLINILKVLKIDKVDTRYVYFYDTIVYLEHAQQWKHNINVAYFLPWVAVNNDNDLTEIV